MGRIPASNMKYNTRVTIPEPAEGAQEIKIQLLKDKIVSTTRDHLEHNKDKDNLTKQERRGKKKIKERLKEQNLVIIPTDKSGKLTLMSKDLYREAAKEHIDKDEEVEWRQVKKTEDAANRISRSIGKIFRMGKARNQVDSMIRTLITKDRAPPKITSSSRITRPQRKGRSVHQQDQFAVLLRDPYPDSRRYSALS